MKTAIALALIPGMPVVPFLVIGVSLIIGSRRIGARQKREEIAAQVATHTPKNNTGDSTEDLIEQMRVHALEVQLADLASAAASAAVAPKVRSPPCPPPLPDRHRSRQGPTRPPAVSVPS